MIGRRDAASSSTFGILGAMALLSTALTAPLLLASDPPTEDLAYRSVQEEARRLATRLTGSADGDWAADPANATGYGLLRADDRKLLDEAKVAALAQAPLYERVRDRTGAGHDFRLSVSPLLPPRADPAWRPLGLDGVAYLAAERPPAHPVRLVTSLLVDQRVVNASAVVTNIGDKPAIYTVEFGLGNALQDALLVQQGRNTRLLAPQESQVVWAQFHALASWEPSITGARIRVLDAFGAPAVDAAGLPIPAEWRSIAKLPTLATATYDQLLDATESYVDSGARVSFDLDHYGAGGTRTVGAQGIFTLVGPDGKEWVNQSVSLPTLPGAVRRWECANCTADGVYTATFYDPLLQKAKRDLVVYASLPLFVNRLVQTETTQAEIAALDALVGSFDAAGHDALLAPGGDVFSDRAKGSRHVKEHLARYQTLVVGSDIAQSALTPNAAKTAIREWVEGGGRLLVLGAASSPQEWMNPLWKISLAGDERAPRASDADDVRLVSPDALAWERYAAGGRAWTFEDPAAFDVVLAPGGDPTRATLAFSRPGAFGEGVVVLSAFRPGALGTPDAAGEAQRLLHDLLVHAHTRMYLQMGPPLPAGVEVAAEDRLLAARSLLFPEGNAVRVRVHVFG